MHGKGNLPWVVDSGHRLNLILKCCKLQPAPEGCSVCAGRVDICLQRREHAHSPVRMLSRLAPRILASTGTCQCWPLHYPLRCMPSRPHPVAQDGMPGHSHLPRLCICTCYSSARGRFIERQMTGSRICPPGNAWQHDLGTVTLISCSR